MTLSPFISVHFTVSADKIQILEGTVGMVLESHSGRSQPLFVGLTSCNELRIIVYICISYLYII